MLEFLSVRLDPTPVTPVLSKVLRSDTPAGIDVVGHLYGSSGIYTDFANQVATCARHVGEEDVSGRWS